MTVRTTIRTARRAAAAGAACAAALLFAACAQADPDPAPDAPDGRPGFHVVGDPAGFTRTVDQPGSPGWQTHLEHEDGCVVESRGDLLDEGPLDERGASVERLEALATESGTGLEGTPQDLTIAPEENPARESSATVLFVSGAWSGEEDGPVAVRGAARVASSVTFEGDLGAQVLELRVVCPGPSVPEDVWDSARTALLPTIAGQDLDAWATS